MRLYKCFFLAFCVVFSSCSTKESKNVKDSYNSIRVEKLNGSTLNFSDFFDKYEIIKLDTKQGSELIKRIDKIEIAKNKIYIKTDGAIKIFSIHGEFLSKIDKRGDGDGEYKMISDFYIDTLNNTIEINDYHSKKIIRYTQDGKYLTEWKHNLLVQKFTRLEKNMYALYCMSFINNKSRNKLLFLNWGSSEVLKGCLETSDNEAWYLYIIDMTNFVKSSNNENIFLYSQNDTIYSINPNGLLPKFVIDYSDPAIPISFFKEKHDDIFQFMQKIQKKDYVGLVDNYHETNSFLTFTTKKKNELYQVFYEKTKGNTKVAKYLNDDLILKGHKFNISYSFLPLVNDQNSIYYSIEAEDFKEIIDSIQNSPSPSKSIDKNILGLYNTIEFSDNPFLIRLKIK